MLHSMKHKLLLLYLIPMIWLDKENDAYFNSLRWILFEIFGYIHIHTQTDWHTKVSFYKIDARDIKSTFQENGISHPRVVWVGRWLKIKLWTWGWSPLHLSRVEKWFKKQILLSVWVGSFCLKQITMIKEIRVLKRITWIIEQLYRSNVDSLKE